MRPFKKRLFVVLFTLPICLLIYSGHNQIIAQELSIQNGKIKLGFDQTTGALVSFKDLIKSHNFFDEKSNPELPWQISTTDSTSNIEDIKTKTPANFSYSKPDSLTLILEWGNFKTVENNNFKVISTIRLHEKKPLSYWKISLEGIKGEEVKEVHYPRITGIKQLGNEKLAIPTWMGALVDNPRSNIADVKYQYPGPLSMQFLALYDPQKIGFYAASNDTANFIKDFSLSVDSLDNLTFTLINYPPLDSNINSYTPTYDGVIGSVKGDWITAAKRYREWAQNQWWSSESRLNNNLTPSWLEKTAYWVWNRGKSPNVLSPAVDLKQNLGLPVSAMRHWWHNGQYDVIFPEYFPPREGKKEFISATKEAQKKEVNSIIYMNALSWGTSTESWENLNARQYADKDIHGNIRSHVYNIFTGDALASMCIATDFWRNKYTSLANRAINTYGVNGIYMDQMALSRMCYAKNHGHNVGGGNYWVKNSGKLTNQIRSKVQQNSNIVLAGEGAGESWLPYLDVFLTLQVSKERYAGIGSSSPIPLFQAVYHEYGITYGSYSSLVSPPYDELWPEEFEPKNPESLLSEDFDRQFLMEQARSFVWGMQPTIANYHSFLPSKRKEEIEFITKLAKVRHQGLKYLLHGTFMRSPQIKFPEDKLKISKLSIYAGRGENKVTTYEKEFPLIYSGTWKAKDGGIGIALANISDKPFQYNVNFNAADYKLPQSGKINIIDADGEKFLTSYSDGNIDINFILEAKDISLIEIMANR